MFSTQEFIEVSRKFVCIRIETYENKEAEQLVRRVLHGKYSNTSFVIFDPQGVRRLTRSGRSPGMAMIAGRSRTDVTGGQNREIIAQMHQIARQYRSRGNSRGAELQDFHSLRQALNCASADQRLLLFVNASATDRRAIEKKLKAVFADREIVGKFHLDFADGSTDRGWTRVIHGAQDRPSLLVVRSSQFGLDGRAADQLPLDADVATIKRSLLQANQSFAKTEKRKNYEQHVRAGKYQRVFFENEIGRSGSQDPGGRTGARGRGGRGRGGRQPRRGR